MGLFVCVFAHQRINDSGLRATCCNNSLGFFLPLCVSLWSDSCSFVIVTSLRLWLKHLLEEFTPLTDQVRLLMNISGYSRNRSPLSAYLFHCAQPNPQGIDGRSICLFSRLKKELNCFSLFAVLLFSLSSPLNERRISVESVYVKETQSRRSTEMNEGLSWSLNASVFC